MQKIEARLSINPPLRLFSFILSAMIALLVSIDYVFAEEPVSIKLVNDSDKTVRFKIMSLKSKTPDGPWRQFIINRGKEIVLALQSSDDYQVEVIVANKHYTTQPFPLRKMALDNPNLALAVSWAVAAPAGKQSASRNNFVEPKREKKPSVLSFFDHTKNGKTSDGETIKNIVHFIPLSAK